MKSLIFVQSKVQRVPLSIEDATLLMEFHLNQPFKLRGERYEISLPQIPSIATSSQHVLNISLLFYKDLSHSRSPPSPVSLGSLQLYSSNFGDFIFSWQRETFLKCWLLKLESKYIQAFVLYNGGISIPFCTMEVYVFSCVQWRYTYSVLYNGGIRIQFCTMEVYVFSFI